MSLRTAFHTAEMAACGFLLPFGAMIGGIKMAGVAADTIKDPALAKMVVENGGPALVAVSALYIGNLARTAGPSVPLRYKLAAACTAGLIAFSVVGDHLENGPFIRYAMSENGQGYVTTQSGP